MCSKHDLKISALGHSAAIILKNSYDHDVHNTSYYSIKPEIYLCLTDTLYSPRTRASGSLEHSRKTIWMASSAGILQKSPPKNEAQIFVFTARTGGLKGALATHSWLVLKPLGSNSYDRYDVVGWGSPVRKNAYDADGHWYSNKPVITYQVVGKKAQELLPQLENANANYPWRKHGDYTLWPGPNSNTFVANVLQQVPKLAAFTPSTAVGRDFPADGKWIRRRKDGAVFATLGGYFGFVFGGGIGLEVNFLGLVAGANPSAGEVKIPTFGAISLPKWVVTSSDHRGFATYKVIV